MIIDRMHKIIYHFLMMRTQNDGRELNEQSKDGCGKNSR